MTGHTQKPNSPDPLDILRTDVDVLFHLNPYRANLVRDRLLKHANAAPKTAFAEFARRAESLLEQFREAPWKRAGRTALQEYAAAIEHGARRLSGGGNEGEGVASEPTGTALAPLRDTPTRDWHSVMVEAKIPDGLSAAVQACQNRLPAIDGVAELMFRVLQAIDADAAFRWEEELIVSRNGNLDPDIARDLLRAWRGVDSLPTPLVEQACGWSTDIALLREWPALVREADALVRRIALQRLRSRPPSTHPRIRLLQIMGTKSPETAPAPLSRWLNGALKGLGDSVQTFLNLVHNAECGRSVREGAVLPVVRSLEQLHPPLLLLADLILREPDGAAQFAYALFGLTGRGWEQWQQALNNHARESVRKFFLRDLHQHRSSVDTLTRLCFGDTALMMQLKLHLNMDTGQFRSIADREAAVDSLAATYASYREQDLLGREVTRRYRQLMRLLHADSLTQFLPSIKAAEIADSTPLRDLTALAAAARRFLNQRRALETSLDHMLTAEIDFVSVVRTQRVAVLRRLNP